MFQFPQMQVGGAATPVCCWMEHGQWTLKKQHSCLHQRSMGTEPSQGQKCSFPKTEVKSDPFPSDSSRSNIINRLKH